MNDGKDVYFLARKEFDHAIHIENKAEYILLLLGAVVTLALPGTIERFQNVDNLFAVICVSMSFLFLFVSIFAILRILLKPLVKESETPSLYLNRIIRSKSESDFEQSFNRLKHSTGRLSTFVHSMARMAAVKKHWLMAAGSLSVAAAALWISASVIEAHSRNPHVNIPDLVPLFWLFCGVLIVTVIRIIICVQNIKCTFKLETPRNKEGCALTVFASLVVATMLLICFAYGSLILESLNTFSVITILVMGLFASWSLLLCFHQYRTVYYIRFKSEDGDDHEVQNEEISGC